MTWHKYPHYFIIIKYKLSSTWFNKKLQLCCNGCITIIIILNVIIILVVIVITVIIAIIIITTAIDSDHPPWMNKFVQVRVCRWKHSWSRKHGVVCTPCRRRKRRRSRRTSETKKFPTPTGHCPRWSLTPGLLLVDWKDCPCRLEDRWTIQVRSI